MSTISMILRLNYLIEPAFFCINFDARLRFFRRRRIEAGNVDPRLTIKTLSIESFPERINTAAFFSSKDFIGEESKERNGCEEFE